jgi:hypothetical protein
VAYFELEMSLNLKCYTVTNCLRQFLRPAVAFVFVIWGFQMSSPYKRLVDVASTRFSVVTGAPTNLTAKLDALTTGDLPKFKFICDGCGSTSIKVAYPERAPETTVVECGRCNAPRGTLAALRDLARLGRNDLFDF